MTRNLERDIQMAADYLRGLPVKQITPDPTSSAPLYRALKRLGITARRPKDWRAEAAAMFGRGVSLRETAKRLGQPRSTVQDALRARGLR
jgi:hypothetical protein